MVTLYVYIYVFYFLGEMAAILFLKKKTEKFFFLHILRGQKSKIGFFRSSDLVFLKDWAELSLNIESGVI